MNEPTDDPLAPRRAALALIDAALGQRGGLDEGIGGALGGLGLRERAFARSLAMTTLRRWSVIEKILAGRLRKPAPEKVMALLRLGATQVLYMDVADHAAVDTTIELAQDQMATRPFKGLLNAVLRGLVRQPPVTGPEDLAPDWLAARWRAAYGQAVAQQIIAMIAEEPPTDLSLRTSLEPGMIEGLQGLPLPGGSLRSGLRGDVAGWPGFAEGLWWVQDAAAAIPARLLNTGPGQTVLDLCAAPGGKTLQLAATGASVTAVDRSASRMRRVSENLQRTGLAAERVTTPAELWKDDRQFDAVIIDAPCSATGTFRRQPEVLLHVKPGDIAQLAGVQARLLAAGAPKVRSGGRLVYCVCSLEPEEGEAQIAAFLKQQPEFAIEPVLEGEAGAPAGSVRSDGSLRILPHQIAGGLDGFYAVRLARA